MARSPCLIYRVDPEDPDAAAIKAAARVVRSGGLVAFPTETVYGLGADSFNSDAVKRIFAVKGRPPDNPLIVHVGSLDEVWLVASSVPEEAWRLVERVWPGPLTIVVPKAPELPRVVTGGLDTVAVRSPAHPVALRLIAESGTPIAAPSANPSGKPSPTRGEHVIKDLDCKIDVILDAGETFMGVESTVIDFTRDPPVLLRPGAFPVEEVERIIGVKVKVLPESRGLASWDRPLAPGMKYRHYSPDTPLVLVDVDPSDRELVVSLVREEALRAASRGRRVAILASSNNVSEYRGLGAQVLDLGPLENLAIVARRLFHALRSLDEMGVDVGIVEPFPERGVGLAIMNRLRKASTRIVRA